jgi:hypothetical protein
MIEPLGIYFKEDVERIFRMRPSTLRREFRLGRLRVARRGGRIICLGSWLIEWVKGGEIRPRKGQADSSNGQVVYEHASV